MLVTNRKDRKCNGAHTWKQSATWQDSANGIWFEEECQTCGLLRRAKLQAP